MRNSTPSPGIHRSGDAVQETSQREFKRSPVDAENGHGETFATLRGAQWRSDEAIALAYDNGGYGMKETGEHFGLHYSRVSRIVSGQREAKGKTSYPPLANLDSPGSKLSDVIEQAAPGDIGKT